MKIYATTCYSQGVALGYLLKAASIDCLKKHVIVNTPDMADIILFVENAEHRDYFYEKLSKDPLIKKYPPHILHFAFPLFETYAHLHCLDIRRDLVTHSDSNDLKGHHKMCH